MEYLDDEQYALLLSELMKIYIPSTECGYIAIIL